MNDIANINKQVPTKIPNPYEQVGKDLPARRIIGQLLKFTKGDYVAGMENDYVPMGTRFLVNMDQAMHGWIKWVDSKPTEQVLGLIGKGFPLPSRESLGDLEEDQWAPDERSRQPRDPWQETFYLLLRQLTKDNVPIDNEDGLYTFTTQSRGGLDACKFFTRTYGKWLPVHSGDFPIMRLGFDQWEHPDFGVIKKPEFLSGYITPEQAHSGKKVRLFNPKDDADWMPKASFGEIGRPAIEEDVPF
jgi:hypothetical protein